MVGMPCREAANAGAVNAGRMQHNANHVLGEMNKCWATKSKPVPTAALPISRSGQAIQVFQSHVTHRQAVRRQVSWGEAAGEKAKGQRKAGINN